MRKLAITLIICGVAMVTSRADECVDCHTRSTPHIVTDWKLSRHSIEDIGCASCHGDDHRTAEDVARVAIPAPETCSECHEEQFAQFAAGKHAPAWTAMQAMPTTHWLPMALREGKKGCGGCHKIGLKTSEEIAALARQGGGYGVASCDACHTRHTFSAEEARQPQACQTCHMGFDHPQWEMYSSSKHGIRFLLQQNRVIPQSAGAPSCQTCHMADGDHEVRTPWGFLAVRLPLPVGDAEWQEDQVTIMQALGILDPEGNPTPRMDIIKEADVARLTQEDFDRERTKLLRACSQCHSEKFAREELQKGDDMIREADRLLARAIRVIARLYADGTLRKPGHYVSAYPDLLTFHDAPTLIEQRLFEMHLSHRMRTFQGVFHNNPDYALWYGWSALVRDLAEIEVMAEELSQQQ